MQQLDIALDFALKCAASTFYNGQRVQYERLVLAGADF